MKIARFTSLTTALVGVLTIVGVATAGGASATVGIDSLYVQTATIPTSAANGDIAVDQTTHRAYVTQYSGNTITVINMLTDAQVAQFTTGATPQGISVYEASNTLWVTETGANQVVELDATTGAVLKAIPHSTPQRLVFDPMSNKVYVTQFTSFNGNVAVIDAATGALLPTITAPGSLAGKIAVNPSAHQIYVSNSNSASLSIMNTTTQTLVATVALPANPNELAVDTSTGIVYVSLANNTVARIDPSTASVLDTFPAVSPRGISVNAAEGTVAVASQTTSTVNIFSTNGTLLQAVHVTAANWAIGADFSNSTLFVSALSFPSVFVLQELFKPVITSPAPRDGVQGTHYTHTVTASGSPTITYSITDGALPDGLTLDPDTGVISGTPTVTGSFTFTVTASNSVGTDAATYTVNVTAPVAATPPPAAQGPSVNTGGSVLPSAQPTGPILITLGAALLAAGAAVLARRRRATRR